MPGSAIAVMITSWPSSRRLVDGGRVAHAQEQLQDQRLANQRSVGVMHRLAMAVYGHDPEVVVGDLWRK